MTFKSSWLIIILIFVYASVKSVFVKSDLLFSNKYQNSSFAVDNEVPFWITIEFESIESSSKCMNAMICSQSRFLLTLASNDDAQKVTSDWSLRTAMTDNANFHHFSYWTSGTSKGLHLQMTIAGEDPTFRFQRICDETSKIQLFLPKKFTSPRKSKNNECNENEDGRKQRIRLEAHCFNVTLNVRKYICNCPWCPPKSLLNNSNANSELTYTDLLFSEPWFTRTKLLIALLAIITTLNILIFFSLFAICMKHRKSLSSANNLRGLNNGKEVGNAKMNNYPPFVFTVLPNCSQPPNISPKYFEEQFGYAEIEDHCSVLSVPNLSRIYQKQHQRNQLQECRQRCSIRDWPLRTNTKCCVCSLKQKSPMAGDYQQGVGGDSYTSSSSYASELDSSNTSISLSESSSTEIDSGLDSYDRVSA